MVEGLMLRESLVASADNVKDVAVPRQAALHETQRNPVFEFGMGGPWNGVVRGWV